MRHDKRPLQMVTLVLAGMLLAYCCQVVATEPAPAPCLTFPGTIVEVYDGDTPTVQVVIKFRARLLDCWAPEVRGSEKDAGIRSRDHLAAFALGKPCRVTVPLKGTRLDHSMSLSRVLCNIQVDGQDLSDYQVKAGHATKEKQRP